MLLLFAVTLFLSGALLFVVEPMFAKMAMPKLGGSPSVWNVCMMCYQALLLAGYSYSHGLAKRFAPRTTSLLQVMLGLAVFFVLPIRLPHLLNSSLKIHPALWLVILVFVGLGLPFFVLSTYSSILQTWYANTSQASARDPYVLYSASNLGNITGLVAYLLIMEPHFGLTEQSKAWMWGYAVLMVLTAACAVSVWGDPITKKFENERNKDLSAQPKAKQQFKWLALAFIPSSLMLGITTALTSELPPIPLLWLLPLTAYLLSFIFVFAGKLSTYQKTFVESLPLLLVLMAFPIVSKILLPPTVAIPFYLITLFFSCMICHGELAASRPAPVHLTRFYLCISLGGVLGGLFNAIIAPSIFKSVAEVPIALFLVALGTALLVSHSRRQALSGRDVLASVALGLAVAMTGLWSPTAASQHFRWVSLAVFIVPLLICYSYSKRPLRFAFGLGALFLASTFYSGQYGHVLLRERSFFGVYKVAELGGYREFFNGSTIHGVQSMDLSRATEPLSYYYANSPIGQIFRSASKDQQFKEVGVVGLGAGSLACYTQPWRHFTFYEIDPKVEIIARDPKYFTFLRDCSPGSNVIIGDARLTLAYDVRPKYELLILDAFGGDSIPVHLVTAEAVKLYRSLLKDHGLLAFHITNRYVDLTPVLSQIAHHEGMAVIVQDDSKVDAYDLSRGKFASQWLLMARKGEDFGSLVSGPQWQDVELRAGTRLWTDEYSSLVGAIHWE